MSTIIKISFAGLDNTTPFVKRPRSINLRLFSKTSFVINKEWKIYLRYSTSVASVPKSIPNLILGLAPFWK